MVTLTGHEPLKIDLNCKYKSLHVFIPKNLEPLILDRLIELFDWLSKHHEVRSVFLRPEENKITCEPYIHGMRKQTPEAGLELIKDYIDKIQTIGKALLTLPQIFITDFSEGANNFALEIGLMSDIRIANKDARFRTNHIEFGFLPVCALTEVYPGLEQIIQYWLVGCSEIRR